MIEINLSPTKKAAGISNVAGINLSLINVKMMVIALLIWFIPEPIIISAMDDEINKHKMTFEKLNSEYRNLQGTIQGMQNIEKQVEALQEQEQKLAVRLDTVKQIINRRQNPFEVLKYVAENIPSEVWIESVEINDRSVILTGYAKTWKNIGEFLESIKNSIFFNGRADYQKPAEMKTEYMGQRVEPFLITTEISRFK
jgi:hypothetical protein